MRAKSRLMAFFLAAMMITLCVACKPPAPTELKFSLERSTAYLRFQSRTRLYSLPEVTANKDVNFSYEWTIESGEETVVLAADDKFSLLPTQGTVVLRVSIIYNGVVDFAVLTYTIEVTVISSSDVITDIYSPDQYGQVDYTANGIGKKRVFGLYDYVFDEETQTFSQEVATDSFHLVTPGYTGERSLEISSSDDSVATAQLVDGDEVNVSFVGTGEATITVKSTESFGFGEYASYSYTYEIVDAINCFNYEQIAALDQAAQANIENARDIVLRASLNTPAQATRFYGNVYGNGYQLDATAYAKSHDGYPNAPRHQDGRTSTDQAAYYMMTNNTVMDNIILTGDSREKNNLNEYAKGTNGLNTEFIAVVGIYGWWESANTSRPEGIVFKNSVIEKGYRFARISGANNPNKPIVFDTCVLRWSGDNGLEICTDEDTLEPSNFEQAAEIACYVTLNDIIIYNTKLPPIAMQGSGGDDFGKAYDQHGSYKKASQVTLTGQKNYFFTWLKRLEMDYGTASVVDNNISISDEIQTFLSTSGNIDLVKDIANNEDGSAVSNPTSNQLNPYFNVLFFGNFGDRNRVILDDSNYAGVITESGGQRWKMTSKGSLSVFGAKSHTCQKIDDVEPNSGLHAPLKIKLSIAGLASIDVFATLSLWMQKNASAAPPAEGQNVFYPQYQTPANIEKCINAMTPA